MSSQKFGSSSRMIGIHEIKFPSMSLLFSAMSRNYRVFPGKTFNSILGEISRFPEQFWLCPETAFVRVVTLVIFRYFCHV